VRGEGGGDPGGVKLEKKRRLMPVAGGTLRKISPSEKLPPVGEAI